MWQDDLLRSLHSGEPLIRLVTDEEERACRKLAETASAHFSDPTFPVFVWDLVSGFGKSSPSASHPNLCTQQEALAFACKYEKPSFFIFKDFAGSLSDPVLLRMLKDFYVGAAGRNKFAFVIGAQDERREPSEVSRLFSVIDFPPPNAKEILSLIGGRLPCLDESEKAQLVVALTGLAENSIRHFLWRVGSNGHSTKNILEEAFAEKELLCRREGLLEYVRTSFAANEVGGLDNLKSWLLARRHLFRHDGSVPEKDVPRGLFLMGIPGSGKSLAVKMIRAIWNVPLFRLDFSVVFSGEHGTPEYTFNACLKAAERLAPVILWIDELENSLGMDDMNGSKAGTSNQVFAKFLTWMQEKPAGIFVAATANRVQAIPGEVIRKGRFDEVFYCGAPSDPERLEILKIHLLKNDCNPDAFRLPALVGATRQWTGSELEQLVLAGKWEANQKQVPLDTALLLSCARRSVPLARSAELQMREIHTWAMHRARSASKYASLRVEEAEANE